PPPPPRLCPPPHPPRPEPLRNIDHSHLVFGLRDFQVIGKLLRAGIAHRDDRLNELTEEFSALGFLVHGDRRSSVAHDIGQPQPPRGHYRQNPSEKSGERARFFADKKCLALWRQRISRLSIFLQQFQADKRIHDCAEASRGRASFFFELLDRLRS